MVVQSTLDAVKSAGKKKLVCDESFAAALKVFHMSCQRCLHSIEGFFFLHTQSCLWQRLPTRRRCGQHLIRSNSPCCWKRQHFLLLLLPTLSPPLRKVVVLPFSSSLLLVLVSSDAKNLTSFPELREGRRNPSLLSESFGQKGKESDVVYNVIRSCFGRKELILSYYLNLICTYMVHFPVPVPKSVSFFLGHHCFTVASTLKKKRRQFKEKKNSLQPPNSTGSVGVILHARTR